MPSASWVLFVGIISGSAGKRRNDAAQDDDGVRPDLGVGKACIYPFMSSNGKEKILVTLEGQILKTSLFQRPGSCHIPEGSPNSGRVPCCSVLRPGRRPWSTSRTATAMPVPGGMRVPVRKPGCLPDAVGCPAPGNRKSSDPHLEVMLHPFPRRKSVLNTPQFMRDPPPRERPSRPPHDPSRRRVGGKRCPRGL